MSTIVKRSSVSTKQVDAIIKKLHLKGKKPKRGVQKRIQLFESDLKKDTLLLPYHFASTFLNDIPNNDKDFPPRRIDYSGILRPRQEPVAKEALGHLQEHGTTTLALHPGFGKTHMGAYLVCRLDMIVLILVPAIASSVLIPQWVNTFAENTNARIWTVGKGKKVPDYSEIDVIVCSNKSVHKIPDELKKMVGVMIVDEAHMFCTQHQTSTFFAFQPAFIILETATPIREDDGLHTMLYNIAGEHQIERGFENTFKVFGVTISTTVERTYDKYGTVNYGELLESYLHNIELNAYICKIVFENPDKKILILSKRTFHCEMLETTLRDLSQDVQGLYGDKKTYTDSRILIGTTSKIGTGFDPANACPSWGGRHFDLLICSSTFKKVSSTVQNWGRGFRAEDPIIYQLIFDDPINQLHWKTQKKWAKSRGGTVVEMKSKESTTHL
jgi:superfamily II DNA or RNA helicase